MSEVPDRKITTSMEEALDYHIAVHNESSSNKIKLSFLARLSLLQSLKGMEKAMKEYGHSKDAIQDAITNSIFSFCNGYEIGKREQI
jgi:hypothetical protein